ncbi:uncharacterized protein LOC129753838 [Uranotaenia lowii]|uniref:uncharacterized protein LOC129753838 n=1 Tax=Uranotaenia lowii TaxID=190385 RepID=UPI0024787F93|nr:uncharacterized protein LOC129753838 [Uranotaenia lowii]
MSSTERKLRSLKARRRSLSASFSNIYKFVENFQEPRDIAEAPVRLEAVVEIWSEYAKVQSELETLDESPESLDNYVQTLFDFPILRRESATELHTLVEQFDANVRILKQLGESTEHWDILLIHLLSTRLDPSTRRDWEEHSSAIETTTFQELTSFIQRRVAVLEQLTSNTHTESQSQFQNRHNNAHSGSYAAFQQPRTIKCVVCSQGHNIYQCPTFTKLSVQQRIALTTRNRLCLNCLRRGHRARECRSINCCKNCRSTHHTLLCSANSTHTTPKVIHSVSNPPPINIQQSPSPAPIPAPRSNAAYTKITSFNSHISDRPRVLLATAVVVVVDDTGKEHLARALLDSGSECCFASNRLYKLMQAKRTEVDVPIAGIGNSSTNANFQFQGVIKSRTSDFTTTVPLLMLPKVTIDLPTVNINISQWSIPENLQLADPAFHRSQPIDLVLGAEIFFNLFTTPGHIYLGDTQPSLINSVFGWVVSGKTHSPNACASTFSPIACNVATTKTLEDRNSLRCLLKDDVINQLF